MLEDAPSPDEAFNAFAEWAYINSENTCPKYYCYGNSDGDFIDATIRTMSDFKAISFAASVKALLVDYSTVVKDYLCVGQVALKKVVALIDNSDEAVQRHDALEDAEMLRKVVENLRTKCTPADVEKLKSIKSTPKPGKKKLPDICYHWPSNPKKKYNADTRATENDYMCKCVDQSGQHIKYFDSVETAAIWLMRYNMTTGHTLRREGDLAKVIGNLINRVKQGKQPYGFTWEIKEENTMQND